VREFKDKVAVITGGANGVGRSLGAVLAARGARVVLTDINADKLEETAAALRRTGADVSGVAADVTQAASVDRLADAVFERRGAVHLLFNNAGVGIGDMRVPFWELPTKDWRFGYDVHVMGAVHGIRAFVPRMIRSGAEGFVVNTTSSNGALTSSAATPIYASSKAALASLTEVLRDQLAQHAPQIKVGLLFPGPSLVNTGLLDSPRSEAYVDPANPPMAGRPMSALAERMGGIKMTEPEDVAAFAVACIEKEQFWMLPEGSDTRGLERRCADIVARAVTPAGG
jgi:NAD(P)-dependent dehydrogenase (short-subunit alcohol dehydrogenase family)